MRPPIATALVHLRLLIARRRFDNPLQYPCLSVGLAGLKRAGCESVCCETASPPQFIPGKCTPQSQTTPRELEKEKAREAGRETRSNKKQKVEPASPSSVTSSSGSDLQSPLPYNIQQHVRFSMNTEGGGRLPTTDEKKSKSSMDLRSPK